MKNNYTLNEIKFRQNKKTIYFILSYSKSIQAIKLKSKTYLVSTN